MTSLATPDQLTDRLQTEVDESVAQQALDNASGLVRGISGQTISFVSQETIDLPGNTRILRLPQRPLVVDGDNPLTVVETEEFGGVEYTCVENRDYSRIGNDLTRGWPWWHTSRLQGWPYRRNLGVWAPRVRVTYSHGHTVIPGDIVAIVLDIAQALYTNPQGLRSWQVPEYSETYATELLGAAQVEFIRQRPAAVGRGRRGAFEI
jgi:hypothetical protein